MIELFSDIPLSKKQDIEKVINYILHMDNVVDLVELASQFVSTRPTQQERDFADFYFNLQLEIIKNESNNDKR